MKKKNIVTAEYTSVWDDEFKVTTECKVNLDTGEVTDIEESGNAPDGSCTREYVAIAGKDYDVDEGFIDLRDLQTEGYNDATCASGVTEEYRENISYIVGYVEGLEANIRHAKNSLQEFKADGYYKPVLEKAKKENSFPFNLHTGDEVTWNDPDTDNDCSRTDKILEIEIDRKEFTAKIVWSDGTDIEVNLCELS